MIKNNKGVTLVALAIAVMIILIVTGMIVYSARDSIYVRNLTNMQNDIANLRDRVSLYYSEYGAIPAETEYPDVANLQSAGVIGANDTGRFLIIELEILDGLTLNYGEDYERYKANDYTNLTDLTDIYIINANSHNIFYVEGIRVKENDEIKMYYTDSTQTDIESVNVKEVEKWHEETNEAGETIVTNGIVELKIGDYVNYDPQTGARITRYISQTSKNGYADQVFNLASYQYGWRVLGVDEDTNEILLVSEDFIGPDSGGQEENGRTYYYLSGRNAYVNGVSELNEISALYGQGKGASGARSITVEDVNRITRYDAEIAKYGEGNIYEYGNEVIFTKNADTGYIEYSASNGESGTSTYTTFIYYDEEIGNWKTLESGQSVTLKNSYYEYEGLEYLNSSSTKYEMLFQNSKNSSIQDEYKQSTVGCWYWLASPCITMYEGIVDFDVRMVTSGVMGGIRLYYSDGDFNENYNGVRPVISLETDIGIFGGEGTSENPYQIQ